MYGKELNYKRVHLVVWTDKNTWLFRTNTPLINHEFAYGKLIDMISSSAKEAGAQFPDISKTFQIKDINL